MPQPAAFPGSGIADRMLADDGAVGEVCRFAVASTEGTR
jgi:hypothetical protein